MYSAVNVCANVITQLSVLCTFGVCALTCCGLGEVIDQPCLSRNLTTLDNPPGTNMAKPSKTTNRASRTAESWPQRCLVFLSGF